MKKAHVDSKPVPRKRSKAISTALRREGSAAASHDSLSRQAKQSARSRAASSRSLAARKGRASEPHAKDNQRGAARLADGPTTRAEMRRSRTEPSA